MSLQKISLLLSAATLCFLTGCSVVPMNPTAMFVTPVTPPEVEQEVRLGVVYDVKEINTPAASTSGKGALIGGIGGGMLASVVNGSSVVKLVSAVAGAVVGNTVERNSLKSTSQVEIIIRLENQSLVAITQAKDEKFTLKKGDAIRIIGNGKSARVTSV